jgi:transcriptional regulator with XRE-family HTH domain
VSKLKNVRIVLNKDYIEKEMKRRNIESVNEMAREIGISESMLNLLMRDKRNPGPKVIGLMLSYFNVNFEKIFSEKLTNVHKSA